LPFCEGMMDGNTVSEIYSEQFISLRSQSLNVSPSEYREKMHVYHALCQNSYDEIHLWFGKDTFCQTNLLLLLAFLEDSKYDGKLFLNYIDDESFQVLGANICVKLGNYKKLYQEILIEKRCPKEVGVLVPKAIDLYFDYHSENGFLSKLASENSQMNKNEFILLLLENSRDYGLSDLQAEKIFLQVKDKIGE
ncbi:MAG: hypothetical protein IKU24_01820, partial [Clostridia bacterium]|nr:hypothetical protein [Clostridia bacterium]